MQTCEVFVSHTGECNVGKLALFVRFSGCTLDCTYCDSKYHKKDSVELTIEQLYEQCKEFNRIVFTGGEPLLQQVELVKLIKKLHSNNLNLITEIETNGTILPVLTYKIIYNVSPKLSNSNNLENKRIVPNVLNWHVKNNSNFKFVVSTIEDLDEVNDLVNKFKIPRENVYLMPLGATRKEQMKNMEGVIKMAKLYGYNFSPRMHILIFNKMRGV